MKKTLLAVILAITCSLSLAVTTLLVFSYLGYRDLLETKRVFISGEMARVMTLAKSAQTKFTVSQTALAILTPPMSVLLPKETIDDAKTFLQVGSEVSQGSESLAQSTLLLRDFVVKVVSGESYERKTILDAGLYLKEAKTRFASATSELENLHKDNIFLKNYDTKALQRELVSVVHLLDTTSGVIEALPKILPENEEKTYLVLFQNNMELRPTGGFIGSFALVTSNRGKMNFTIHDVYDADGQLKGHVAPPMPIRKYIPQINWFLRDANFDPDFPKSGELAAWFLEKEIGLLVNGVAAVDLSLAQMILKDLGEISLSDYRETITSENIFSKTEKYVQEDSFPGSRQKKNFLAALARALIDKLGGRGADVLPILRVFPKAAEEKHLLLAFFDPSVQQLFSANSWDGALSDRRAKKQHDVNDFLAIREANLGVNKANLYIKRNIHHGINIKDDGSIEGEVEITYYNQSPPKQTPSGTYKNYLRVYVPNDASFVGINIDGKKVETVMAEQNPIVYEKKGFAQKIVGKLEVEQREESGLSMIGFLVEVPVQSQKTVSIVYRLPVSLSSDDPVARYNLTISKQPGTDSDPFVLTINHPSSFTVKTEDPSSIPQQGKLIIPSDLSKDRQFSVEILRKE